MSLTGTLDVSARSMLWHSQSMRFLREFCSPAHLMFQRSQCFDTFKVCGSSGNVARRCTWCFSEFNTSIQSIFEVLVILEYFILVTDQFYNYSVYNYEHLIKSTESLYLFLLRQDMNECQYLWLLSL